MSRRTSLCLSDSPIERVQGVACDQPHPGTHEPALATATATLSLSSTHPQPCVSGSAFPRLDSADHTAVIDAIPILPFSATLGFSSSSLKSLTVLARPLLKSSILTCFQTAAFVPQSDGKPREIPPPTPVRFPRCVPQVGEHPSLTRGKVSLVPLLQNIHRPADIRLSHFEALGLHVIADASPQDLLPDTSFLPPVEDWNAIPQDDLLEANEATRKPLNNGNLSPGVQTYRERQKELLIDNAAAFRTIRRIPAPAGEVAARLGNAYEFYKNLEFFSGYWHDTSLGPEGEAPQKDEIDTTPLHLQTHVRTGTGSQLPPDYRQHLLTAFVKLVAYDFGCNVSFPRVEPRLHLTPPQPPSPPSYFNSSVTFIYRTPTARASARAGIVEGPVAALSAPKQKSTKTSLGKSSPCSSQRSSEPERANPRSVSEMGNGGPLPHAGVAAQEDPLVVRATKWTNCWFGRRINWLARRKETRSQEKSRKPSVGSMAQVHPSGPRKQRMGTTCRFMRTTAG